MAMSPKKDLVFAYALAGILLVVGILGYTAYPAESPKQPLRIMYRPVAGKVLFDHQAHFSETRHAVSCQTCHHHPEDDDTDFRSCGECHQAVSEEQETPEACLDCHATDEIEGTDMSKSADAMHTQCIDCHKESQKGPVDCQECHVM